MAYSIPAAVKVIVQWCVKGLALETDQEAKDVIDTRQGIMCNWWRRVGRITPDEIRTKLSPMNLDRHVNHFDEVDPGSGRRIAEDTPFISLSAGVVDRDALAKTNYIRRARQTALWFGSQFGQRRFAYLFLCWVVLAPRPAVEIEGVAEEIRDLNAYRRYSAYQPEGEITAKVQIPDNQIWSCERWDLPRDGGHPVLVWTHENTRFTSPEQLSNVRELI